MTPMEMQGWVNKDEQLLRVGKEGAHSLLCLHNRTETVTTYISQKPLSFVALKSFIPSNFE
jgi:hypothetical protein